MFPSPFSFFCLLFFLALAPASAFALLLPPPSPLPNPNPGLLLPRAPTITPYTLSIWRVPNTATYLAITLTSLIPSPAPALQQLLSEASAAVLRHLHTVGDGLLAQGALTWYGPAVGEYLGGDVNAGGSGSGTTGGGQRAAETGGGLTLQVWNANNHQLTYGVVGAAVMGLKNWMLLNRVFGTVRFEICDGNNMVGQGVIE